MPKLSAASNLNSSLLFHVIWRIVTFIWYSYFLVNLNLFFPQILGEILDLNKLKKNIKFNGVHLVVFVHHSKTNHFLSLKHNYYTKFCYSYTFLSFSTIIRVSIQYCAVRLPCNFNFTVQYRIDSPMMVENDRNK